MFAYVFYLIENKKGDIEIEESDMLELASDYDVWFNYQKVLPQNFIGVHSPLNFVF